MRGSLSRGMGTPSSSIRHLFGTVPSAFAKGKYKQGETSRTDLLSCAFASPSLKAQVVFQPFGICLDQVKRLSVFATSPVSCGETSQGADL